MDEEEKHNQETENSLRKKLSDLLKLCADVLPCLREYLGKSQKFPHDIHYRSMVENILKARRKPFEMLVNFYEEMDGEYSEDVEADVEETEEDTEKIENVSQEELEEIRKEQERKE